VFRIDRPLPHHRSCFRSRSSTRTHSTRSNPKINT